MRDSTSIDLASSPLDPHRLSSWRQVGTSVAGCTNARNALEVAGLTGWNIRKVRQAGTEITLDGTTTIENPERVMLVRTDPRTGATRYLSTVGKRYGIKQNEMQAAVLDALVAESGADGLAEAGELDGGKRTFVTMKLPATMRVGGVDPIDLYIVVFNSHDGSSCFRVCIVPFRVRCANQLGVAIANHVSSVSIRHTRNSTINIAEIRSKLGLMYDYAEAFEIGAQRMLDTELTAREFSKIITKVWSADDRNAVSRGQANAERRETQLMRLWTDAPTQKPISGTRWAAFQAITEYLDHFQPAKDAATRANRVLTSTTVAERKQSAFDLLSV